MVQFRPGSHVSKLAALLSFVGEFPFQSLGLLGSERVYKALVVKLCAPEVFRNTQTMSCLAGCSPLQGVERQKLSGSSA